MQNDVTRLITVLLLSAPQPVLQSPDIAPLNHTKHPTICQQNANVSSHGTHSDKRDVKIFYLAIFTQSLPSIDVLPSFKRPLRLRLIISLILLDRIVELTSVEGK